MTAPATHLVMTPPRPKTSWPVIHGSLFVAILVLFPVAFPTLAWPWFLLLPLALYTGIAVVVSPLRRTIPWPSLGRPNLFQYGVACCVCVLAAAVLVGYQMLVRPDVTALAAVIPVAPFGSLLLAGACFSVANAVLEELVFRWVLYEAINTEWGAAVAVAATAVVFGLGHAHGYPPGNAGTVLAGLYGIALGSLRWWTGGLGLSIGCHITADATIFGILFS